MVTATGEDAVSRVASPASLSKKLQEGRVDSEQVVLLHMPPCSFDCQRADISPGDP